MKLASKFIVVLVLGAILLLGIEAYFSRQREIDSAELDMRRNAQRLGESVKLFVADVWRTEGPRRALQLIDELDRAEGLVRIRWVWLDAASGDPHCPLAPREDLAHLDRTPTFSLLRFDGAGRGRYLTYVRLQIGRRPGALEIAEPLNHYEKSGRHLTRKLIMFGGTAVLLGGALIVVLGNVFVGHPLNRLIEKTRRIGRGDLSGPIELRQRDEFGELADAINAMCNELADAQDVIQAEVDARAQTTEQLRHAERLNTVGRLASGIAHELGTPLNVVSGRAELIASGKLSPEETTANAEIIRSESKRITKIVRQLLDFARRKSPQKAVMDLRHVVLDTMGLLKPMAQKGNYVFTVSGDAHPVLVKIDEGQIQQVLTNLMVNAAQSMPHGGTIETTFDQKRAGASHAEEESPLYCTMTIQDHGSGISAEDIELLFEPFFTTKPVGEGTGLGLSVSYGIIQEHDGWIDVESRLGEGSRFTIYLPAEGDACAEES